MLRNLPSIMTFFLNHVTERAFCAANRQSWSQALRLHHHSISHRLGGLGSFLSLVDNRTKSENSGDEQPPFGPFEGCVPMWRFSLGFAFCLLSGYFLFFNHNRDGFFWLGAGLFILGSLIWLGGNKACEDTYRNYGANRIVHKVNTNCPSLPKRWIDSKLVHLVNQNYEIVT